MTYLLLAPVIIVAIVFWLALIDGALNIYYERQDLKEVKDRMKERERHAGKRTSRNH